MRARPPGTGTPSFGASALAFGAGAFGALRHRNFRIYYGGHILSMMGTWMQSTAQGWLVLELTDSEFLLGTVTAAGSLPILLFTLYAGVVADRVDKRRILLTAQCAALVFALVLAVLIDTGRVTLPWILVLVFLIGTASAFEVPTRQSFFVELVGKEDLTNAIALNSSAFNLSRIVGPAVAGVLIGAVGIAVCFYVNAASYLAVIAGLLLIRRPKVRLDPPVGTTLERLGEGFGFLRRHRLPAILVGLVAATSILGTPYGMLLPVFARDVLDVGATGLGALLAATGTGALTGAIALAAFSSRVRRGPLMIASAVSFCLFVLAFCLSRSFPLSLVLLAGAGATLVPFTATVNALLQSLVPNELRGRVMGVYVFMFLGMTPIGALQAGALARLLGAPVALALGAGLLLSLILVVAARVPEMREVR